MSAIAVVGAGAFGTALANVLAKNDHKIRLYIKEIDAYQVIENIRENARYLPGVPLHRSISLTMDLAEAIKGAEFVLLTVPAQYAEETMIALSSLNLNPNATVILTSKGLIKNGMRLSDIAARVLPKNKVCGIYGIMFAKLIAYGNGFASMCIASPTKDVIENVANLFRHQNSNNLRIYISNDLCGAEFGAAMKNVYAITMGIFDGYHEEAQLTTQNEDNRLWIKTSRHSLINLCMMEFINFGLVNGAKIYTLLGPSGIGDIQAGISDASRNYRYGRWYAKLEFKKTKDAMPELHEGVDTVRAAMELSKIHKLDMPILKATYNILFEKKKIQDVIPALLTTLSVAVNITEENKLNEAILKSIQFSGK